MLEQQQVDEWIAFLPKEYQKILAQYGWQALDMILDLEVAATEPYTPQRFIDETQGMADGSKVDYMTLRRLSLFPELIQARCSMVGAWGDATPSRALTQLRALDWSTTTLFQNEPLLLVHFPTEKGSHVRSYAGGDLFSLINGR
jgi:hypothetical protein